MNILELLNGLRKRYHIIIGLCLTLVIGYVDFVTGYELRMELFYLLPISYVTWFVGQRFGILFSVLSLVTMVFSDILAGKRYTQFTVDIVNGAIYFVFYVMVIILLRLQKTLQQRESLIAELDRALSVNEKLSNMLPLCANCRKVRDDAEYLRNVALYIDSHPKMEFSRGLCKECLARLSPPLRGGKEDAPSC